MVLYKKESKTKNSLKNKIRSENIRSKLLCLK